MNRDKVRTVLIGTVILSALLFVFVAGLRLLGFETVSADATPYGLTASSSFSHEEFGGLLEAHVHDGRVDYEGVRGDERLRRYCATLAENGPRNLPNAFPNDDEKLAYYINAYNALVLLGVVHNWPIDSVNDVRGAIRIREGFGFFFAQRFNVDGRRMSLYALENKLIRKKFGDPRVHAALNCASISCPELSAEPYTGADLDEQLDRATRRWVADPYHVRVDEAEQRIVMNPIFEWYADDFAIDGGDALDWVIQYSVGDRRAALERARDEGFEVQMFAYDWGLNGR